MKYQAATTIEVPINFIGKNFFPDIQKIASRKIQAITVAPKQIPIQRAAVIDYATANSTVNQALFLSLTNNGSSYFISDVSLDLFNPDVTLGVNIPINRSISVMDCYITCTSDEFVGSSVVLTIWYECVQYSNRKLSASKFDNFDVPLSKSGTGAVCYFPDIRTLSNISTSWLNFQNVVLTPSFNPGIITDDILHAAYITLVKGSFAVLDRVPLSVFFQLDKYNRLNLDNIIFDMVHSYIEFSDQAPDFSGLYANFSIQYNA